MGIITSQQVATLTPSQRIAPAMAAYQKRTGRKDGLAVIKDTLSKYGAERFSDLSGMQAVQCVDEIIKIFAEG